MPRFKSVNGEWKEVKVEQVISKPEIIKEEVKEEEKVEINIVDKKEEPKGIEVASLDLNNDDKVDKKDASIAGKVLNATKKKKGRPKKKSTNSKS